jgi:undecaprenyl-diphosphatase
MIFASSIAEIQDSAFIKMFQVSIQFGAILAVVFLYWTKFFKETSLQFYLKLGFAVIPALVLGLFFDDLIESVLEKPVPVAVTLIVGGVVLIFVDRFFKHPRILREEDISFRKAITIGFWQCLAMMPGTSRSAASIIGGMQQGLSRKTAAEFSFFLAVPTMLAVTCYSIFLKNWEVSPKLEMKGYEMIFASKESLLFFLVGNVVAFLVAVVAIKFFIGILNKYGFKVWGWYRIVAGSFLLLYFLL